MYAISKKKNSDVELYHHGILGMKWGKRNGPPYPLDASDHSASEKKAGWRQSLSERREASKYDYRKSKSYTKASRGDKMLRSVNYRYNKKRYGKRAANRIEYQVDVKKADRAVVQTKAYIKASMQVAALTTIPGLVSIGKSFYEASKNYAAIGSIAADLYGHSEGLNVINGGFTTGIGAVKAGMKFTQKVMASR